MPDMQQIGNRLAILRGEKSRAKVAKDNHISVSTLQMYENGQRMPKDKIKVQLARYYNKTVQELFYD